jgi:transposase
LSRIRRRLPLEVHQAAFAKVLTVLAKENLLKGKPLGVDATTLEANAAMRSIVRRDNGDTYEEFLTKLAQASGIETPTKEDLIRLDRQRKKRCSNKAWFNPHEPDAKIGKMKTGETHFLHKCEKADDLDSGAVVAITLQPGDKGDTETGFKTVAEAARNLATVQEDPQAERNLTQAQVLEVVQDKGYHSNDVLVVYDDEDKELRVRTYIAEPQRKRRNWQAASYAQVAVYANRRRIRSARGKRLFRRRAEICERGFAHLFTTGGMRRTHLRGHQNILKRLLIHTCGFNLGLIMRKRFGLGTPRGLYNRLREGFILIFALWTRIWALVFVKLRTTVPLPVLGRFEWRLSSAA